MIIQHIHAEWSVQQATQFDKGDVPILEPGDKPVKLICVVCPAPHASFEETDRHWRDIHGPLVKSLSGDGQSEYRRYTQSPSYRYPAVEALSISKGWPQNRFVGVTEVWFDNIQAVERTMQAKPDLAKQELMQKDEKIMATPNLVWVAGEDVVVEAPDWKGYGSDGVKLVVLIKRKPGLSWKEWSDAWTDLDALYKRLAPTLGIKRYVQTRCYHSEAAEAMRKHRNWPHNPFDGLATFWFDSYPDMLAAASTPQGQEASAELSAASDKVHGECVAAMGPERLIFEWFPPAKA